MTSSMNRKILISVTVAVFLFVVFSYFSLAKQPNKEWWEDTVVVSNCLGGANRAVKEISPEACNWTFRPLPPQLLAKEVKYIPFGAPSYQKIEYEDGVTPPLSEFKKCFAKDINGKKIPYNVWGKAYYTDPHCPKWHKRVEQKILSKIPYVDGISQDNLGGPPFIRGVGGFSKWSQDGFKSYLAQEYPNSKLQNMGIKNLEGFDIARYIKNHGFLHGAEKALHDPIFRSFVKYQYESNLALWADIINTAKEKFPSIGKTKEIHGNQYGVWKPHSSNPYSVLLSQYHDLIEIEFGSYGGHFPPKQHYSLVYKLGLASGGHHKPVWVRGIIYNWKKRQPIFKESFWRLVIAEGYANGGIRVIPSKLSTPEGDYPLPEKVENTIGNYADWLHRYKPFFTDKTSVADVAIIYSIPSMMWRFSPATGHENTDRVYELSGFARALEDAHIPYDMIVFNHPGVGKSTHILGELSKYDTLILPSVDCLTNKQIQALRQFVKNGGHLIATGELGARNENFKPRETHPLSELLFGESGTYLNKKVPRQYYKNVALEGESDPGNYQRILQAVKQVTKPGKLVKTSAPKTVSLNLFRQEDKSLLLHLLNYNYNRKDDSIRPVQDISVKLKLPQDFSMEDKGVFLLSPARDGRTKLSYTIQGKFLKFSVPRLKVHDLVVITKPGSFPKLPKKGKVSKLPKILFDEAHNEEFTVAKSRAKELKPKHPKWKLLNELSNYKLDRNLETPLTIEKLNNYNLLVVASPKKHFSSEEIRTIKQYVKDGGGLVLIGDSGIKPAMNKIAEPFGAEFKSSPVGSFHPLWDFASFNISDIPKNKITNGVREITMNWGSTLEINQSWKAVVKTPEDTWLDQNWNKEHDPTEPKGPFNYLAIREFGEGRIAAITNARAFWKGKQPRLVYNIVSWLSESSGPPK